MRCESIEVALKASLRIVHEIGEVEEPVCHLCRGFRGSHVEGFTSVCVHLALAMINEAFTVVDRGQVGPSCVATLGDRSSGEPSICVLQELHIIQEIR
jgi:hypothetical protein